MAAFDMNRWARLFGPKEHGVLQRTYEQRLPLLEEAQAAAMKAVAAVRQKHQRRATLRIAYIDGRVKPLPSLIKKAFDRGIPAAEVFDRIDDVVGLRIVVNNGRDIEPLIEELRANGRFTIVSRENHAGERSYRAVHLKATYRVTHAAQEQDITMEIQIRTLLQDAWAILTHHDVYKNQAALPPLAQPVSERLSELFSTLDRLADDLRMQMERIVQPPNDLSDDAPLDKQGISFLYYKVLGENPQEYEVQSLLDSASQYGLRTIGDARHGLTEKVTNRFKEIHDGRFPGLPMGGQLLEQAFLFAARGPVAFEDYRKHVEAEWEDIERTGRAEALAELPDTFEKFVADLKRGKVPWEAIWGAPHCQDQKALGLR